MENNDTHPIDINTATADELASLPGLEPEQAEAIVEYRVAHGPFDNPAQVIRVEGIDDTTYNIFLQGRIVAGQPPDVAPMPGPTEEPDSDVATGGPTRVVGPAEEEGVLGEVPIGTSLTEEEEPLEEDREPAGPFVVEEPDEVAPDEEEIVTAAEPRFAEPPPPSPPPPPQRFPRESDGNGCVFTVLEWLVLVFLGTVLGAALTLGFLYAVNGTLDFSNVRGVRQAESALSQVQRQQADLAASVSALELQSDRLSQSVVNLQARFDTLEQYTGTLRNELEQTSTDMEAVREQVGTVDDELNTLQSDVEAVATESAEFDNFLTRLRDVLIDIQGTPVPTMTPTRTATPTRTPTATLTSTATASPTRTATAAATATRTPSATTAAVPGTTTTPAAGTTTTPATDTTATPAAGTTTTPAADTTATPVAGTTATPTP
jgi:competence ComEA-like helix-hairpin-helix protein